MKWNACSRWLSLAAIALFSYTATARPLLVPAQPLEFPRAPGVPDGEAFASYYGGVAIDEGTLLVEGSRAINAQGERVDGVHIFQRDTAGRWIYAGVLTDQWQGDLRIDGAIATIRSETGEGIRVFERGATGWALSGVIANPDLAVVRIEDGSLFTQTFNFQDPTACVPAFQEYRKVNGTWTVVATIGGERCARAELDVNDGRALITHWNSNPPTPSPPAQVFAAGQPAWTLTGTIAQPVDEHERGAGAPREIAGSIAALILCKLNCWN